MGHVMGIVEAVRIVNVLHDTGRDITEIVGVTTNTSRFHKVWIQIDTFLFKELDKLFVEGSVGRLKINDTRRLNMILKIK